MPSAWSGHLGAGFILHKFLLLDVGPHAAHGDSVDIEEVVAKVELIEIEGNDEGCERWGVGGCADEGECEVWSLTFKSAMGKVDRRKDIQIDSSPT